MKRMNAVDAARLDRSAFEIGSIYDDREEVEYWRAKSPEERMEALELMRQMIYGYDPATTRLQRVFEVVELERGWVPVIGGYAVNYYGYARAAADLDIWIGTAPENAERAASVVREFGFAQAEAAAFVEPGKVIRMGVPPVRLEILTTISGVEFAGCYARRRKAELDGVRVPRVPAAVDKSDRSAASWRWFRRCA
jgi:hypothetical protein